MGPSDNGSTYAHAYAVNDAGAAVGYANKYVLGSYVGDRAVLWLPDSSATDLNDVGLMPVPFGGTWTLLHAYAVSSGRWVAGIGSFDPDSGGVHPPYLRAWVTQVGLGGEWTDDFSGSLDGTWGRGKQWSTGMPAMQVGNATFNQNAAYTVSLDRDELTNAVNINAGIVTLKHNGFTLTATDGVTIASGATLRGSGAIIGDVIVEGTIAPGNSPGTIPIVGNSIWAGGGSYLWKIHKADGPAGTDPGWDLLDISGTLTISAIVGNEVVIDLTTLDLANAGGPMDSFNGALSYLWTIATAAGGIIGFDPAAFILDTSVFTNSFARGVAVVGAATMPEPATVGFLVIAGSCLVAWRSRLPTKGVAMSPVSSPRSIAEMSRLAECTSPMTRPPQSTARVARSPQARSRVPPRTRWSCTKRWSSADRRACSSLNMTACRSRGRRERNPPTSPDCRRSSFGCRSDRRPRTSVALHF